ncbi:MAG TPA: DUF4262 domain-containing protein [Ktedonobacterales bacterium]|jgi:hypothetical protein
MASSTRRVFPTQERPGVPFAYSVGIPTTVPGATELIILGLYPNTGAQIINSVVARLKQGETFADGQQVKGLVKGLALAFRTVTRQHYDDYVGAAQTYHQSRNEWLLLQIVWPDTKDRFPWQDGFEERFKDKQPLLFQEEPPGRLVAPPE